MGAGDQMDARVGTKTTPLIATAAYPEVVLDALTHDGSGDNVHLTFDQPGPYIAGMSIELTGVTYTRNGSVFHPSGVSLYCKYEGPFPIDPPGEPRVQIHTQSVIDLTRPGIYFLEAEYSATGLPMNNTYLYVTEGAVRVPVNAVDFSMDTVYWGGIPPTDLTSLQAYTDVRPSTEWPNGKFVTVGGTNYYWTGTAWAEDTRLGPHTVDFTGDTPIWGGNPPTNLLFLRTYTDVRPPEEWPYGKFVTVGGVKYYWTGTEWLKDDRMPPGYVPDVGTAARWPVRMIGG
jgi:hypothetical protein